LDESPIFSRRDNAHVAFASIRIGLMPNRPKSSTRLKAREASYRLPVRIVVGSDGAAQSMGAIRLAAAIQRASDGRVFAISAVETVPVPMMPNVELKPMPTSEATWRRTASTRLRRQMISVPRANTWTVAATLGWPAEAILHLAKTEKADLIVVGIGRHRPIDRLLASETAIAIVRRSPVPVLAAASHARALPGRALAAVDFTSESIEAARLAASIVGPKGHITLAHVSPFNGAEKAAATWAKVYNAGAREQLGAIETELVQAGYDVDSVVLHGCSPDELLRYVDRHSIDLVSVGGHKQGVVDRLVIGSVTTRLLRGAPCSVLVSPSR
jgi:nucleotide-binding universal stress UspA family protein